MGIDVPPNALEAMNASRVASELATEASNAGWILKGAQAGLLMYAIAVRRAWRMMTLSISVLRELVWIKGEPLGLDGLTLIEPASNHNVRRIARGEVGNLPEVDDMTKLVIPMKFPVAGRGVWVVHLF